MIGSRTLVLLLFASTACATSRGELDVRIAPAANPADGPAIKIAEVQDRRVFELKPQKPSIPSLKKGDIDDPQIVARAIARKRNTYGKALGDILLPEGRTIEMLATEVVTKALRDAGFRVLASGEPGYEEAAPVKVIVEQFWAWMTPGFATISLDFQGRFHLDGVEGLTGSPVDASSHTNSMSGSSDNWMKTIQLGIDDLIEQIRAKAKKPGS